MIHVEQIKRLAADLAKCAEWVRHGECATVPDSAGIFAGDMVDHVQKRIGAQGDISAAYGRVVDGLLGKNGWADKYSERFLDFRLTMLIWQVRESSDSSLVVSLVEKLCYEYDQFNTTNTVYLPLVGLNIDTDYFEIGRITLCNFRRDKPFVEMLDAVCSRSPELGPGGDLYRAYFQALLDRCNNWYRDTVFARCSAVAEGIRTEEYTIEETRKALDLIRYAMATLQSEWRRYTVGILGETTCDNRSGIITIGSDNKVNLISQVVKEPSFLTAEQCPELEKIGFFKMSEWLKKDKLSAFEETILTGVHWVSMAQMQGDTQNVLLNLVACLETFLTGKGSNPTAAVTEGAALLLESEYEKRKRTKKEIAALYTLRSNATHGHKSAPILKRDLDYLVLVVSRLIQRLLDMDASKEIDFTTDTKAEIERWLEEERLGKHHSV